MIDLLRGTRLRLAALDPEEMGRAYAAWGRDSEFKRLLDTEAVRLHSSRAGAKFFEKETGEASPACHYFSIRALADDRLLGDINLDVVNHWGSREAFIGLGIGDRRDWGRGYGTEAMNLALRFAFDELILNRVSLSVFEYNPRAIRSYEKAGFRLEGRRRGALLRAGRRWDILYMGILRQEWKEMQP